MGGSSPHCPGAGRGGMEEAGSRTPFSGLSGRLDLSARGGYASKRWLPQNGSARNGSLAQTQSQVVLNGRGSHVSKASRREWGECFPVKGKVLASRIVVTAVLVWLVFQSALLLRGIVTRRFEINLPGSAEDLQRNFLNVSKVARDSPRTSLDLEQDDVEYEGNFEEEDGSENQQFFNASTGGYNSSAAGVDDYEGNLEEEVAAERGLHALEDAERVEEEELDERKEQAQATFEDVNRGVKRAEREKFENHERDDGELERTGQPLCIYETYDGNGAWPFLHRNYPLYRGLSLSPRGKRPKLDDIDAASRLVLLNDTFYRDSLCDFGGFLAIANRIDRIHKNSWIGFQPWLAAGKQVALSQRAETSLVEAMRHATHGDAFYFWAKIDGDTDDFWSFCDTINAGSCRKIFMETITRMYGFGHDQEELLAMPSGAWSSMHCWAMSTSSFMEFVMFSRMFLDALDNRLYVEHHDQENCVLATTKLGGQHCYCRLLELVINVWAYHSARRIIYVDPQSGLMLEQNPLLSRRGLMKVKWFSFSVLKGMDEDRAEKADDEHPTYRWLWPHTGEVFWQGILERERVERYNLKMERKRRNKERLARMRSRYKQKSLGRYVKPPPEPEAEEAAEQDQAANTVAAAR